jgi:hypothetical protein
MAFTGHSDAHRAVDALVGIDDEHVRTFVKQSTGHTLTQSVYSALYAGLVTTWVMAVPGVRAARLHPARIRVQNSLKMGPPARAKRVQMLTEATAYFKRRPRNVSGRYELITTTDCG